VPVRKSSPKPTGRRPLKRAGKPRLTRIPAPPATSDAQIDSAVDAFLRDLNHPRKPEIEAIRRIILGVNPAIREGIKWNAPSFRTADYFATVNLRGKGDAERVWLILHTGAKAKGIAMKGRVADPTGLLKWLTADRCLVTFEGGKDIQVKRPALESVVRKWIKML
jgi:hypothetical protein